MRKFWSVKCTTLRFVGFVGLVFSLHCAGPKEYTLAPLITEENDTKSIPKPEAKDLDVYEEGIENLFGHEINEATNLSWHIRKISNNHKRAKNLNALDEVPNSTWFRNRNAHHRMSLEEIKRGPNRGRGPNMDSTMTIIGAKTRGVSAGFLIEDSRGERYLIKFDRKGFPQLNTAAEVITTKFVYAAGYNTPENYLTALDPNQLRVADGLMVEDRWGREVPMKFDYVQMILDKAHANPDGTYRVVASKLIEGEPLGPFRFSKTRPDDPNDHVPHHHRRELRGYQVIASWLNNSDAKASNTLDVYVTENGKSFVRHYMIDFGTSLGSSGYGAAGPGRGHRSAFDFSRTLSKILTLGLWVEPWEKAPKSIRPSIGYFDAKLFDPGRFKFIIPNPAFQKATELDNFWGAKIVMSFTDKQIKAVVETAEYSNSEDEEYLIKTLIKRRDKIGRYWYGKVNPLDDFHLAQNNNGLNVMHFEDLSVTAGFETAAESYYRYRLGCRGDDLTDYYISKGHTYLEFNPEILQEIEKVSRANSNGKPDDRIFYFEIETKRGDNGWGKKVRVHFYYPTDSEDQPRIVALEREN
ncbi:hypothetical protein GWN42_03270 [candidate division KSB1 bacterium]|nr:hypothetical protein [candidate division KSB1 bacterium]